eukprot:jgi/Mesvir1/16792/Mv15162-RA.1
MASPESPVYAASIMSIREAAGRIAPHVHRTPTLSASTSINDLAGCTLHFKCEIFQKGGSFKIRGATNAVFSLTDDAAARGVVTHSSGNHAAAVAMAAKRRGVPAYIVVPHTTPACKVDAVARWGGVVTTCAPTMAAREEAAARIQRETGAAMVPPFNHGDVISGQGTIALELLEQVPQLDAIVVPISGGGMISGITIAAKALKPSILVIAAEPLGADDAARSKSAGTLLPCTHPATIADGLRASMGDLTWPVVRDLVDAVVTVSESEIVDAMQLIFERMKLVVEPSGAVGLAAVLAAKRRGGLASLPSWQSCSNVGVVLCGGNIDLAPLWDAYRKQT